MNFFFEKWLLYVIVSLIDTIIYQYAFQNFKLRYKLSFEWLKLQGKNPKW